jgi:hypothetical protein
MNIMQLREDRAGLWRPVPASPRFRVIGNRVQSVPQQTRWAIALYRDYKAPHLASN